MPGILSESTSYPADMEGQPAQEGETGLGASFSAPTPLFLWVGHFWPSSLKLEGWAAISLSQSWYSLGCERFQIPDLGPAFPVSDLSVSHLFGFTEKIRPCLPHAPDPATSAFAKYSPQIKADCRARVDDVMQLSRCVECGVSL